MSKSSNKGRKKSNNKKKVVNFSITRLIIFIVLVSVICGVGFGFKYPIENYINKKEASEDVTKIDENGLSVYFIDVGQGDSIAIRFPDNKTMLVDAGPTSGTSKLLPYLKNNFFKSDENKFDYLLLTHSDSDHCGGMEEVCNNFIIDKIYRPKIYSKYEKNNFDETETYGVEGPANTCTSYVYYKTVTAFNNEIASSGENAEIVLTSLPEVNTTEKIEGEGYEITFYSPNSDYISKSAGTVINDFSPIMVLSYKNRKIMLTGDASTTSEEAAMEKFTLPDVDLLKVGHHGSATSTGEKFLAQIKPEIAVISVGQGNKYHHPTQATLNRLKNAGSKIYRTDENGNIIANVTSTDSQLNIYLDTVTNTVYIQVEYLIGAGILICVYLCFGIRIKEKNKKN